MIDLVCGEEFFNSSPFFLPKELCIVIIKLIVSMKEFEMIKKIMTGVLFVVSVGLPLNGMHEQKTKKTIYSVEQLREEVGRARQEISKNRSAMYEDMIKRGKVDYNPVIKVDMQSTDSEKK